MSYKLKHIIFGNYGDNTIALIQWAYQTKVPNVTVVHVATGWSAPHWKQRILQGQQFVQDCNFKIISLAAKATFSDLVRDRKSFPSGKYQWCPSFLKGLPFLSWLDEVDPACSATVLLGSRRCDSRARANLNEFVEESEHYGERRVWFPLFNHSNEMRDHLIKASGFDILNHRSLECYPCIHSPDSELMTLDATTAQKVAMLEQEIQQVMFPSFTRDIKNRKENNCFSNFEAFDMGCGSYFVCGE